ncbi:MAG: hypothetical protein ACYDBZ_15240 [Steroidobacteraceae bacterium]
MIYIRALGVGIACVAIGLAGCGGGDPNSSPPQAITTQIMSDPGFDGDIEQISPTSFIVTQGMSPSVQSVFAGINPGTLTEFRAFLDFPLSGPGGIPGNAVIESAFLDIRIDNLQPPTGTLPILIELVSFQPPTLIESDFDRALQPPLAFVQIAPPFSQVDVGSNVSIDVTSLLVQARQMQFPDFQVRILEDLGPAIPVLIEIDDTIGVNRGALAPLLMVTYF